MKQTRIPRVTPSDLNRESMAHIDQDFRLDKSSFLGGQSYLDESMTPIVTPLKPQDDSKLLSRPTISLEIGRPFEPSERTSYHLEHTDMVEEDDGERKSALNR